MLSPVQKTRMMCLSKTLQKQLGKPICWPAKVGRWYWCYEKATRTITIKGDRTIDKEVIFVGAPCYDLKQKLRFEQGVTVSLSNGRKSGIYAGLLRGSNGKKQKTMLIFAIRQGNRSELIVRDNRAYKGLWYIPGEKASHTAAYEASELQTAFEGLVTSRRRGQWHLGGTKRDRSSRHDRSSGQRASTRVKNKKAKIEDTASDQQSKEEGETACSAGKRGRKNKSRQSGGRQRGSRKRPAEKYQCTKCCRAFGWKSSLMRHIRTVHDEGTTETAAVADQNTTAAAQNTTSSPGRTAAGRCRRPTNGIDKVKIHDSPS